MRRCSGLRELGAFTLSERHIDVFLILILRGTNSEILLYNSSAHQPVRHSKASDNESEIESVRFTACEPPLAQWNSP